MLQALLPLLLMTSPTTAERSPAPAPNCLDARVVTQMRQLSPTTLIVASGELRFQIEVESACPNMAAGSASLLAAEGWVCGQGREFVQTAEQLCSIRSVAPIETRDYSQLARAADQANGGATMAAVEVREKRSARRGFWGSYDYCFRPSEMRSWAADDDGILVQTSKFRSGGYGAYRVELGGSCPQIAFQPNLKMRSGVGLDLICGNAGDEALLFDDATSRPGVGDGDLNGEQYRFRAALQRPCPIVAVYPVYD